MFLFVCLAFGCEEKDQYFPAKSFRFNQYKDEIPCDSREIADKYKEAWKGELIRHVRNPELEVHLPNRFKSGKIPFFIVIPGNDEKSILYGSQGEKLFDELKNLNIGVGIWTYRLPSMVSENCKKDILQKDLDILQKTLLPYFEHWGIDPNKLGIVSFDTQSTEIFESLNSSDSPLFFQYQIYLDQDLKDARLEEENQNFKNTNVLLLTNTEKLFPNNVSLAKEKTDMVYFHKELQSLGFNSTLIDLQNSVSWRNSKMTVIQENVFPWIIRKVDFDNWGRKF